MSSLIKHVLLFYQDEWSEYVDNW